MKALPNKACAARNPAPRRSGAAGPPDRRSCKASASRTNDPERDAASEGADVGRSGNEVGRRPLLGLAAFLGAGGVGVLGAEATPTVEEMLERTKVNRTKNDAARYATGEANYLRSQFIEDTRTPEQLEALTQRMAREKEGEPEVLSPEPEPAVPELQSAGAEAPPEETPRTEEVPATETSVEPAVVAESPGEEIPGEETAGEEAPLQAPNPVALEEDPALARGPGDPPQLSAEAVDPEQPAAFLSAPEEVAPQAASPSDTGGDEIVQGAVVAGGIGIVGGAVSFLRTLIRMGDEEQLKKKALERHRQWQEDVAEDEDEEVKVQEEDLGEVFGAPETAPEDAAVTDAAAAALEEEDAEVAAAEEEIPVVSGEKEETPVTSEDDAALVVEEEEIPVASNSPSEETVLASDDAPSEEEFSIQDAAADVKEETVEEVEEVEDLVPAFAAFKSDFELEQKQFVLKEWPREVVEEVEDLVPAFAAFKSDFELKRKELVLKEWPRETLIPASFFSTQRSILQKISDLEERALKLQYNTSLEKTQSRMLQEVSSFDKRALELQYTTSAQASRQKLMACVSEVERRALELQAAVSTQASQQRLMARISEVEKKALEFQSATSTQASQKKSLADVSEEERKALEFQSIASAQANQKKSLAGVSEEERKALEFQSIASADEQQKKMLAELDSLEKQALRLQYTTSAEEIQRKSLQDLSVIEKSALELQFIKSAAETRRRALQDLSEAEVRALERQQRLAASTKFFENNAREIGEVLTLRQKRERLNYQYMLNKRGEKDGAAGEKDDAAAKANPREADEPAATVDREPQPSPEPRGLARVFSSLFVFISPVALLARAATRFLFAVLRAFQRRGGRRASRLFRGKTGRPTLAGLVRHVVGAPSKWLARTFRSSSV